jgi:hypothetical protein
MKKQRGFSLFGWLFILILLGLLAIATLRILPLYLDYFTVVDIVERLYEDGSAAKDTPRALREKLNKRFRTNNLWDLDSKDVVHIGRDRSRGTVLEIRYEVRTPLFYNLSVIANFEKTFGKSS